MAEGTFVQWLIGAGVGPAAVALPVNWAAGAVAGAARRWWSGFRKRDDLSRLVRAAAGDSFNLDDDEFGRVRELLCEAETWRLIGRGTLEDLTVRVAGCLQPRAERQKEQSEQAAEAIARGLLEFVVSDLDPAMFQKVLLARLDRLATDQASLLEERLSELHADLYSDTLERLQAHEDRAGELLGWQEKLLRQQYRSVVEHLKVLANRLPPRPAGRGDLRVYLTELVAWLDQDRWPQRLGGPALSPSAIERTLHVKAAGETDDQLPADEVADRCRRLVILGEPGAGKTWLAKRTARRCAERALSELDNGGDLESLEVPMYMTCRDLLSQDGDLNAAVTTAAVDRVGYLGPQRRVEALRSFFANRETSMLVVIDSLDEAASLDQRRLGQLNRVGWRVVLTSRPSAWTGQIALSPGDASHLQGQLQALAYPDDVDPFIERWFRDDPAQAEHLVNQIRRRPDLQKAATVPLILAFYCILGGDDTDEPLPRFRHSLYDRLIRRLLSGYWRDPHNHVDVDPDRLHRQLRSWAWQAAPSHQDSGLGNWQDEFGTPSGELTPAARELLDHIAAVSGEPDIDTGTTPRRFIHRSIHEHLVAQHLADPDLSTSEAAEILLPHLWYDPDWEYAAPAAVASRPDRDPLLHLLLCRAAGTQDPLSDLSAIDAWHEIRRFLARLATETNEADWSQHNAQLIADARRHLAQADQTDLVVATVHWATSNAPVRAALIERLTRTTPGWIAGQLVTALVQLAAEPDDKATARAALIELLTTYGVDWIADDVVTGLVDLDPTPQDTATARAALINLLTPVMHGGAARGIVTGLVQLAVEPEDGATARAALIDVLAATRSSWVAMQLVEGLVQLAVEAEDRATARAALTEQLTTTTTDRELVYWLVPGLVQLAVEPDERTATRATLTEQLATAATTERWLAGQLATGLVQLAVEPDDRATTRATLIEHLTTTDVILADKLVTGLVQLAVEPDDRTTTRAALLDVLAATTTDRWLAGQLATGLVQLATEPDDQATTRAAVLELLVTTTSDTVAAVLVERVEQLGPTPQDTATVRAALIEHLTTTTDDGIAGVLAEELARFDPTPQDTATARAALIGHLTNATNRWPARSLTTALVQLATEPDDRATTRAALAELLTTTDGEVAEQLVIDLVKLAVEPEEMAMTRAALIDLLTADRRPTEVTVAGLVQLDPTRQERATVRAVLIRLLGFATRERIARRWVTGLVQLAVEPDERATTRATLVDFLASADRDTAGAVVLGLAQLDPTPKDLVASGEWRVVRAHELLQTARRNVPVEEWLEALPSLTSLSRVDIAR